MAKTTTEKPLPPNTPRELAAIPTDRQIATARFSPAGDLLVTGGYDGSVRRWTLTGDTLAETTPIGGHHGWVEYVAFHPDGQRLVSADSWGRLQLVRFADEDPEPAWFHEPAHDGWIRGMALSEDGSVVVTGGRDRCVRVWETATGKMLHELAGHPEEVFAVGIHPDGQNIVSGDLFGAVKQWDLRSGKCVRAFDLSRMHYYDRDHDVAGLRSLRFIDGGRTLVCGGMDPSGTANVRGTPCLHFVDWESGQVRQSVLLGDPSVGFVFGYEILPDGTYLVVTSGLPGNGRVYLHRPGAEQPLYEEKKLSNCHALALHPDHRRFVVTATNRNSQGNGAVRDQEGKYVGNTSPIHLFELPQTLG